MKLLRYGPAGQEKPGLLDSDVAIRDLSAVLDDIVGDVLSEVGLTRIRALDHSLLPIVSGTPRYVSRVSKFTCVGLNFADCAARVAKVAAISLPRSRDKV
jgi:hypothetical protein